MIWAFAAENTRVVVVVVVVVIVVVVAVAVARAVVVVSFPECTVTSVVLLRMSFMKLVVIGLPIADCGK